MKHNGWTNYDTWKVVALLDNVQSNYYKIIAMNDDELVMLTINDLQRYFNFMDDDIDFDQVNLDEIVENILEGRYENIQYQR
jgi:hypothetical protein